MAKQSHDKSAAAPAQILLSSLSFEPLVTRLALALGRCGVTPDALTFASLVPALACAVAAASGAFMLAAICLLLSGMFDLLDGALARATKRTTAYGALLDSTLDRLADAAPLLGLSIYFAPNGWMVAIPGVALVGAYLISYVRARAGSLGAELPWLWMRRSDRLILLAVALLLGAVRIPGIAVPAPLTLFSVAVAGVLNILAFIAALAAARSALRADPHRLS